MIAKEPRAKRGVATRRFVLVALALWIVVLLLLALLPVSNGPATSLAKLRGTGTPSLSPARGATVPSGRKPVAMSGLSDILPVPRAGSPAATVVYGSAVDYSAASTAVASAASSFAGGGWSTWFAVAEALPYSYPLPASLIYPTGCPYTAAGSPPPSGYFFSATNASAPGGASAIWVFELRQSNSTSPVLVTAVFNGSADLLYTEQYSCSGLFSTQALPPGVIDSTAAASTADASGGSTFLTRFPGAERLFGVVSNSSGAATAPNYWGFTYAASSSECSGGQYGTFEALVNSLTGALIGTNTSFRPCGGTFLVTFSEIGLAPGTSWSVSLNATLLSSNSTTISSSEPNGSYAYSVLPVPGYTATPTSGNVTVSGGPVNLDVQFSTTSAVRVTSTPTSGPVGTTLSVSAAGLQAATTYVVGLQPMQGGSSGELRYVVSYCTTDSVGALTGRAGAAPCSASVGRGYYENLPLGPYLINVSLVVNASREVWQFVNFSAETFTVTGYSITFTETGLSSGAPWTVSLDGLSGLTLSSSGTSITFTQPNGSATFNVTSPGYSANPPSGTLMVNGGPASQQISFSPNGSAGGGGGGASLPPILGLPGAEGYVVAGAGAAVAVIVGVLVATHTYAITGGGAVIGGAASRRALRRRRRSGTVPPPSPGKNGATATGEGGVSGSARPPPPGEPSPSSPAPPGPTPVGASPASCPGCGEPYTGSQKYCTTCGRPR